MERSNLRNANDPKNVKKLIPVTLSSFPPAGLGLSVVKCKPSCLKYLADNRFITRPEVPRVDPQKP